ncbi:Deoxycytidine kinase 1 [Blastocladiella emersonii ATCC 22665]|nr:Deoxycytidine kinase 1 [Blastocladiella emersonii ATCC 22665]
MSCTSTSAQSQWQWQWQVHADNTGFQQQFQAQGQWQQQVTQGDCGCHSSVDSVQPQEQLHGGDIFQAQNQWQQQDSWGTAHHNSIDGGVVGGGDDPATSGISPADGGGDAQSILPATYHHEYVPAMQASSEESLDSGPSVSQAGWVPTLTGSYGIAVGQFVVPAVPPLPPRVPDEGTAAAAAPVDDAAEPVPDTVSEAVAEHARVANIISHMLPLNIGDLVQLLEYSPSGWYRGYVFAAGVVTESPPLGIFPAACLHVKYARSNAGPHMGGSASGMASAPRSPVLPPSDPLGLDDSGPGHSGPGVGFLQPLSAFGNGDRGMMRRSGSSLMPGGTSSGNNNMFLSRFRPLKDRIRVNDKSIDFEATESPNESLEDISSPSTRVFNDPTYLSPSDQWLSALRDGMTPVDQVSLLPVPEYPALDSDMGVHDALIDEVSHALRDLCASMRHSLQTQNYIKYAHVKRSVVGLFRGRNKLLVSGRGTGSTPESEARLRKELVKLMGLGNALLHGNRIVRNEATGAVVTDDMATIMQIKDLHVQLESTIQAEESRRSSNNVRTGPKMSEADITSHLIFLEIKGQLPDVPGVRDLLEFRFSIYSRSDMRYMTDEFVILHEPGTNGAPGTDKPGLKTLFTDFSTMDTTKDSVLVCRVVRVGRLKEADATTYRCPLAAGTLDIQNILAGRETQPTSGYLLKLYAPINDSAFPNLPTELMGRTGAYEPLKSDCIFVNLRLHTNESAAMLPGTIARSSRMGFGDPIDPAIQRNTLYMTLEGAELQKQLGKTFEVALQIRNDAGEVLPATIHCGAGLAAANTYESLVYRHVINPRLNEIVRVDVPDSLMDRAHLFFAVRPCSSSGSADKADRTVAFGFKPLLRANGSVVPDGPHEIALFKYEKRATDGAAYLAEAEQAKLAPLKEVVRASTFLVSTRYTQNMSLVKLLNWRKSLASAYNDMPSVLKDIKLVAEMELIKFAVPVVDSLFGVLCSPKNDKRELSRMVLDNLLHLFSKVYHERDRRYIHLHPVLQDYLENKFDNVRVADFLIHGIVQLIEDVRKNPKNTDAMRHLNMTFKVFVHFFRFILQCGILIQKREEVAAAGAPAAAAATSPAPAPMATATGDPAAHIVTREAHQASILSLMSAINDLMGDVSDHLSPTQQLAFQNFAQVIPLLTKCYSNRVIVDIVITFTDALLSKKGSIVQKKLAFILTLIRGPLFHADSPSRRTLTEAIVRWLRSHIGWWEPGAGDLTLRTQIYNECVDILAELLDKLQTLSDEDDENSQTVLKLADLLPNLLEAYRDAMTVPVDGGAGGQKSSTVSSTQIASTVSYTGANQHTMSVLQTTTQTGSNPGTASTNGGSSPGGAGVSFAAGRENQTSADSAKIASTFLSVFSLMSETKIAEYFVNVYEARGHNGTTKFVHQVCNMIESILRGEAYPSSWVNLNLIAHRTALKIFRSVALIMQHHFMPPSAPKFDHDLWRRYFSNVFTLLNSPYLQKETWSAQQWRTAYKLQIPMLISQGAQLLKALWKALGTLSTKERLVEYQLLMIPTLLPLVTELTMSRHESLCQAASYVLFSMIKREYQFCRSIKRLESFSVDHLDTLILARRKGDDMYRRTLMFTMCRLLVKRKVCADLRRLTTEFLLNVDRFLILLLALRSLPPGTEYEDEQWSGIYKLAKFMRAIGRNDIYLKYVHHLAIKQLNSNNFVEAGWTLKLHSDMLTWSDRVLDAAPDLGFDAPQKEYERKEELLQQILLFFEEGKAWESAIAVCKELLEYYDVVVYNYEKQAETLQKLANLYQSIIKQQRFYSEYFRVGFYGMGFPATLRNKQFVYRGIEWEKLGTFCERIQNKHPDSALLKNNSVPGPETLTADGRFLQITAVVPEPDLSQPVFQKGDLVPEAIRSYYQSNNVNRFSVSRPFRKGAKTGNEFLDLWTEKTTYTTEDVFPHLLRRSEVIESTTTEYSPIENAVQAMVAKNRDLIALEKKYEKLTEPQVNCSPLSMAVNGSVDAPVNGGVFMYKKAFIKSNYRNEYPDKAVFVQRLEEAIDEQVIILDRCIAIHNRVAPAPMRPLHDTIVAFFQKNFAEEIERLGITAQYDPPPNIGPFTSAGYGTPLARTRGADGRTSSSLSNIAGLNSSAPGSASGAPTSAPTPGGLARKGTVKLKERFLSSTTGSNEDVLSNSGTSGGGAGVGGSTAALGTTSMPGNNASASGLPVSLSAVPSAMTGSLSALSSSGAGTPVPTGGHGMSPSATSDSLAIGNINSGSEAGWKRPGSLLARMRGGSALANEQRRSGSHQ